MVHWGGDIDSENIYIEGDNLDALKLLRETYLGKVKMIYIDPPYNTGNDFIYEDDFSQSAAEYADNSGQTDEEGNRMVQNNESNGQYHTDWLNMIYPRIKIAKDLLSPDGVMMVSIDYHENFNLRKIMDEIFGVHCFIGEIYWESKTKSQNTATSYNKLQPKAEMVLVYSLDPKRKFNLVKNGEKEYPYHDENGVYREYPVEVMNANGVRGRESMIYTISDGNVSLYPPEGKQWQLGEAQILEYKRKGNLFIRDGKAIIKMRPEFERNEKTEPFWAFFSKEIGTAESAKKELSSLIKNHGFDTVKPVHLIKDLIFHATDDDCTIIDFFSGSATTAHATMQLNALNNGKRKYILIQIPGKNVDVTMESNKYENLCNLGEERIRNAGKKIKEETGADIDYGFRCFKVDSSNMKEVYYRPADVRQLSLDQLTDNIKEDRTPEDLLFQVMLDLGVLLSSKIEEQEIAGKRVFSVADGYLIACFDKDVTEDVVTQIAKSHPFYAVFRDSSMADDSVAANFEQIFATYSPETVRKVL